MLKNNIIINNILIIILPIPLESKATKLFISQ